MGTEDRVLNKKKCGASSHRAHSIGDARVLRLTVTSRKKNQGSERSFHSEAPMMAGTEEGCHMHIQEDKAKVLNFLQLLLPCFQEECGQPKQPKDKSDTGAEVRMCWERFLNQERWSSLKVLWTNTHDAGMQIFKINTTVTDYRFICPIF